MSDYFIALLMDAVVSVSVSVSAETESFFRFRYRFQPKRKKAVSASFGFGRNEKKPFGRTLIENLCYAHKYQVLMEIICGAKMVESI